MSKSPPLKSGNVTYSPISMAIHPSRYSQLQLYKRAQASEKRTYLLCCPKDDVYVWRSHSERY